MNHRNQKRVVFLASDIGLTYEQSGGAGTHIRGTILGFKENGIKVLPILGGDVLGKKSVINNNYIKGKKINFLFLKKIIPQKIIYLYRDFRRIYYDYLIEKKTFLEIKNFAPDAIYERSALLSNYGVRLSRKLNIPLFIESDGCMPEINNMDYGLFSVKLSNYFEKIKFKKANYIAVYNQFSLLFISKKFGISTNKLVVKTLGIEPLEFLISKEDVEKLKLKYNLNLKKIVGFVGSVSKYHGVDLIIESANILAQRGVTDIVFFIVGWSKEANELKLKAEKLKLNNVIFAGHIDKKFIPLYYKMFDIGIIPDADPNIYPIKVLEYGLYGLCPLVPDYEVFNEIIKNEVSGVMFAKKNANSLADIVFRIFSDNNSDRIKLIGDKWKQHVLKNFKWKDTVKNIVQLIGNK